MSAPNLEKHIHIIHPTFSNEVWLEHLYDMIACVRMLDGRPQISCRNIFRTLCGRNIPAPSLWKTLFFVALSKRSYKKKQNSHSPHRPGLPQTMHGTKNESAIKFAPCMTHMYVTVFHTWMVWVQKLGNLLFGTTDHLAVLGEQLTSALGCFTHDKVWCGGTTPL